MNVLNILYEDNHLLVAVKPAGMPVQSDPSGDMDMLTMLKSDISNRYNKPGEAYLGLVHRMDRPVGGVIAFARTSKAAARLSEQLRAHSMRRTYIAVVQGIPDESGTLTDYLLKDGRANMVSVVPEGTPNAREAILHYERLSVVDAPETLSLLEIQLETGRSHQIRVQCASRGWPLWGDARYGLMRYGQTVALWGQQLMLTHPTKRSAMRFSAPPPEAAPWNLFNIKI